MQTQSPHTVVCPNLRHAEAEPSPENLLSVRSHLRAVFLENHVEFNLRMRAALIRLRAGEIDTKRFVQLRNNAIGNALQGVPA